MVKNEFPFRFLTSAPLALPVAVATVGSLVDVGDICLWLKTMFVCSLLLMVQAIVDKRSTIFTIGYALTLTTFAFAVGQVNIRFRTSPVLEETLPVMVGGEVVKVIHNDKRAQVIVKTDSVSVAGRCIDNCRCLVSNPYALNELYVGQRLLVYGQTQSKIDDRYSDFDYTNYLRTNDLRFALFADSIVRYENANSLSVYAVSGAIVERFSSRLRVAGLSEENIGVVRGIILGDRSLMPRSVQRSFSYCGTAHILAVSGLHVGLIYVFLVWLLGPLRVRHRRATQLLILFALWSYAVVVGLAPSVVRATTMISTMSIARMAYNRVSQLHALSIAMLILLIFDPLSVRCIGTWLSFCAVGGIMAVGGRMNELSNKTSNRYMRWLINALLVSTVAQLSTLPITVYLFHQFPTYFLINNIVVSLLLTPMIIICIATALMPMLPCVGVFCNGAISGLTNYMIYMSQLPNATIDNIFLSTTQEILLTLFVILCIGAFATRNKIVLCATLLTFSVMMAIGIEQNVVEKQSKIVVYTSGRYLNIGLYDGNSAQHIMSRPNSGRSLRAADFLDRQEHCGNRTICGIDSLKNITVGNVSIDYLRGNSATKVGAKYIVVDCGAEPQNNLPTDAMYLISPSAEYRLKWSRDVRKVIMLKEDEVLTLK